MAKFTIQDIADMAGVSKATVSFVLNDREGVSKATREHVKSIIAETGFTPNVHTRRLNFGKSFTVHVVIRKPMYHLSNQFLLETLQGIFETSQLRGYSLTFTFVSPDYDHQQLMTAIRSKECDGLILYQIEDPMTILMLQKERIPFVCVDSHVPPNSGVPLVEVDYFRGSETATEYLIENGHRKIGYIGPIESNLYYDNTFGGYLETLRRHSLSFDPDWVLRIPYDTILCPEQFDGLFLQENLPTAVFCAGDIFAIPAMRFAKQRQLRVPEQLSFIGLDDLAISSFLDTALTTMSFDKQEMGEKAMELLFRVMTGEAYQYGNYLPMTLVARDSVCRLAEHPA